MPIPKLVVAFPIMYFIVRKRLKSRGLGEYPSSMSIGPSYRRLMYNYEMHSHLPSNQWLEFPVNLEEGVCRTFAIEYTGL